MNKVVLLTLIGTLAWATQGCSFISSLADSQRVLEKDTAQSIPLKTDVTQAQQSAEDFADLELESETKSLPEIAGLIPATDPDARVRSSVRGRNDPFSVVALNPRIKIKEEAKLKQEVAKQPNKTANQGDNTNRQNEFAKQNQANRNDTNLDFSAPQPIIEPTLANNVVISGLYKANGRTRLIVKAPEESNSRYVEVGQYLSNGQVLVKRVEQNSSSNPTIILEQSGTEVEKTIGENSTSGNSISSLPAAPTS